MDTTLTDAEKKALEKWGSWRWRLRNVYEIVNESAEEVKFSPRPVQEELYDEMWWYNIIVKARQPGISTAIELYILDYCIFHRNISAGIIAHSLDDAKKLLETKLRWPYSKLPDWVKNEVEIVNDSKTEIRFSNGSGVWVDTSVRSATVQILHISEFAKICRMYPDKAREVVTGCLNAIHRGQRIFIESTSQGKGGYFWEYCREAKKVADSGRQPSELEFKLFFFPWWRDRKNQMPTKILISQEEEDYFNFVQAKESVKLTEEQKSWYAAKKKTQGKDMKLEHPSTFDECFESDIDGLFYFSQITMMRSLNPGHFGVVPHSSGYLVDTWWDLGYTDDMCLWFTQTVGREIHVIDFYRNHLEGFAHYADVLQQLRDKQYYKFGYHVAPHDIGAHEYTTGTSRLQSAREVGINFVVCPRAPLADGIQAVRRILPLCFFDEKKCAAGIEGLESYSKMWDRETSGYKDKPEHKKASHPADAFRTFAQMHNQLKFSQRRHVSVKRSDYVYT